jgi:hypothetical protein
MPRFMLLAFLLAGAAVSQLPAASAQDKGCLDFACRANYPFRTCDKPLPGTKVFSGRVLAVSKECSNTIVQMQIENWEASRLPRVIEVVIKSCGYFAGKIGDFAQVALIEPSPDVRRYDLECSLY